ncbi:MULTISPECIES: ABC transporter ATP-binding protein [unclassified Streptomyces]|uniref:ABC transporter ATP-binding protein n=1 Tax=unclassified Streptomyces TaxID=2593676 RepID=UPI0003811CEF|nr:MULTISPECIES: ABC transporter ATP-binding protein [unclassified Streptomyces]
MLAIEAKNLRRTYTSRTGFLRPRRTETEAVRGVTFEVARGELFGLLGPNGAGKTTTIKMLNTLLLPTSGTARVLGHDVASDPVAVRRRIGYVFGGDRGLYDRLSALDNLRYFVELYGVEPRDQKRRIAELLDLVGLAGREKERVEGYSRGMRQRLHIARGLLHRPDVLFLDEPSIGVDPVAARDLRRTVADLRTSGTTVLLTTHYMAEADELCDRIAVIAGGTIRALGTPERLKSRVRERDVLEIEAYGAGEDHLERIRAVAGVHGVAAEDRGSRQAVIVQTERGADLHVHVLSALKGVRVGRVVTREPTLEDAYIAIVEEAEGGASTSRATGGARGPDAAPESDRAPEAGGVPGPFGSVPAGPMPVAPTAAGSTAAGFTPVGPMNAAVSGAAASGNVDAGPVEDVRVEAAETGRVDGEAVA